MLTRTKKTLRLAPVVALMGAGLVTFAGPASAATCTASGGLYGVDTTAATPTVAGQTVVVYDLIGYSDLSSGCVSGVLDIQAVPTVGTPGTCTFVLPATPGTGTGCTGLLGVTGVNDAAFQVTLVAELVAAGADGSSVHRTATCSVFVSRTPGFGPRCGI
jgi:hypothetical protein